MWACSLVEPENDPYNSYVVLACHFDGTQGSTVIVDDSIYHHNLTAVDAAKITTSTAKFGQSLDIVTSGSKVEVPHNPVLNLSDEGFTIEMFVRLPTTFTWQDMLSKGVSAGTQFNLNHGSQYNRFGFYLDFTDGSRSAIYTPSSVPDSNTFYHIAACLHNGVVKLYIDGVGSTSFSVGSRTIQTTTSIMIVGLWAQFGNYGRCYIDDLRITNGICRYTEDFTPPIKPFPQPV